MTSCLFSRPAQSTKRSWRNRETAYDRPSTRRVDGPQTIGHLDLPHNILRSVLQPSRVKRAYESFLSPISSGNVGQDKSLRLTWMSFHQTSSRPPSNTLRSRWPRLIAGRRILCTGPRLSAKRQKTSTNGPSTLWTPPCPGRGLFERLVARITHALVTRTEG